MTSAEAMMTPEDDERYTQSPLGAPGRYEYPEGSLDIGSHLRVELRRTTETAAVDESTTVLRHSAALLGEHVRRISKALDDRTKQGETND